ncbi:FAD binding domain-containing protein [soil metagenome]
MDIITVRTARVARSRDDLVLAPGERVIGGGTWLYSEQQPGVTGVVDLLGMPWPPVTRTATHLVIAATCPIAVLRELPDSPLFLQCADSLLASWKIQRIATVGGNIALSLPAGPMTSLAVALDAELVLWTADDERRVPAADFVTGVRSNVLRPGEVLRSIEIPLSSLGPAGFRRIALSPLGRTGTLVTARDGLVTVTGGTTRPHQLRFADWPTPEVLAAAVDGIDDWYTDAHGAADWRRAMSRRFALELLEELA